MARYEVKLVWQFSPGMVDGSKEIPPKDILDESGRIVDLAQWPQEPLFVEATDHVAAVAEAQSKRGTDGTIFVPSEIGRERVQELTKRERPGSNGKDTSVDEKWLARAEGDEEWRLIAIATNPTLK